MRRGITPRIGIKTQQGQVHPPTRPATMKLLKWTGCHIIWGALASVSGGSASGKGHLALAVFRCFSCPRASWDILRHPRMSQDALEQLKHLKTARARWPFSDVRPSQAHVAVADIGDTGPGPNADSDDFEVMDLTSINLVAMSITRPLSAESINYSLYAMSTISEPTNPQSTLITPAYLISLKITQNSVLDSACTQYIIRDRSLFWSYDPAGAKSVGTANCRTLETLATGHVKLRLVIDDGTSAPIHINWMLRNCLHAPDCPINLISVSTLNKAHMSVTFVPNSVTTLTSLDDPEKLGRLTSKSFPARVINKLSFLDCNFAYPASDHTIEPIYALPVFPPTVLNPELWHCRLGHLGMDTTWDVLTKDTVTGITWTGSFTPDHWIPYQEEPTSIIFVE